MLIGLGILGLGQVKSAERFEEQNCQMRSHRYHCLSGSKPSGTISSGKVSSGIGLLRMLNSSWDLSVVVLINTLPG